MTNVEMPEDHPDENKQAIHSEQGNPSPSETQSQTGRKWGCWIICSFIFNLLRKLHTDGDSGFPQAVCKDFLFTISLPAFVICNFFFFF